MNDRSLRRALPGLTTASHQLLELLGGSGVIGQAYVGLPVAAGLSALLDAAWVAAALDRHRRDRLLAVGVGNALAAPALHFTLFPWRMRWGFPALTEAEGLQGPALAAYNTLLYLWTFAGIVALNELPGTSRRWTLVGVLGAIAFRQVAKKHIKWIEDEAMSNPKWWNRAWREGPNSVVPEAGRSSEYSPPG